MVTRKAKTTAVYSKTRQTTGQKKAQKVNKVDDIVKKFRDARDYVKNSYFNTWDDCWKVYNNVRTERADYESVAETFVPETFTIVESVLANIAGGKPKFEFYPTRPDQNADTKVLNALGDQYWVQNRLGLKVIPWVRESIMYGTSILFCTWAESGFVVQHIPLKDFFIDPTARTLEDPSGDGVARYAGFRYLTTIDELKKKKVINTDFDDTKKESDSNPKLVSLYKNLDELEDVPRSMEDHTDKEEKDMFFGSTLGERATDEQVEVIYFVDREKLYEIGNRRVIIREEETPFQRKASERTAPDDQGIKQTFEIPEIKPFLPFAALRNYIDSSLFYAKGDVEVILDVQEHLNDTANQKTDNLSYILNRMFTLDPAYADKIEEIDSVPGAIFTIPPGALDQIVTQPIGQDADNEMMRSTDSMRRATAADEIIQGAGQERGRLTATEVRAQLTQAGTRFSLKLNVLESEGYAQLASVMFKLIQINVTQEMAVRKIGPKGVEWQNYNPGEYLGDYEPKVLLDTTARAMKEEDRQKWIEYYNIVSKLPFVDQVYAFKQISSKIFEMDEEDAEAFIQQQPQTTLPDATRVPPGVTPSDLSPEVAAALFQSSPETEIPPLGVNDVVTPANAGA